MKTVQAKHIDQKWAVSIDRPYYPSIDYFSSEEDARTYAREVSERQNDGPEAPHEVTVCVVEIASTPYKIRTHY